MRGHERSSGVELKEFEGGRNETGRQGPDHNGFVGDVREFKLF